LVFEINEALEEKFFQNQLKSMKDKKQFDPANRDYKIIIY